MYAIRDQSLLLLLPNIIDFLAYIYTDIF